MNGKLHAPITLPQGKEPLDPLNRMLVGPQSHCGHYGEEKKCLFPTGSRTQDCSVHSLVTVLDILMSVVEVLNYCIYSSVQAAVVMLFHRCHYVTYPNVLLQHLYWFHQPILLSSHKEVSVRYKCLHLCVLLFLLHHHKILRCAVLCSRA